MKSNCIFMKAEEVQALLGVSRAEAYRIIKQLNMELQAKGYMIIAGRVSRRYLEQKIYGYEEDSQENCSKEE